MVSAASCLEVPEAWLDVLGNWRLKASAVHVRTARKLAIIMQRAISAACCNANMGDYFDDDEAIEVLAGWMRPQETLTDEARTGMAGG